MEAPESNKHVIALSLLAAGILIVAAIFLWPKSATIPGSVPSANHNTPVTPTPVAAPNLPVSGDQLTPVYTNASAANIVTSNIGYDLNNASIIVISGQSAGWYFEASFPVEIKDNANNVIGTGVATAQADWMTASFVPFVANITLNTPYSGPATVILHKDNPSGEPVNDASVSYAVTL